MKTRAGRYVRPGRVLALTAGAAVLPAGCSGATLPTYYYPQRPSPYVERLAPVYALPSDDEDMPASQPRPRYVRAAPPVCGHIVITERKDRAARGDEQ
jgi:hypothetical protein